MWKIKIINDNNHKKEEINRNKNIYNKLNSWEISWKKSSLSDFPGCKSEIFPKIEDNQRIFSRLILKV